MFITIETTSHTGNECIIYKLWQCQCFKKIVFHYEVVLNTRKTINDFCNIYYNNIEVYIF